MEFQKMLVAILAGYVFYYSGLFLADSFLNKKGKNNQDNGQSFSLKDIDTPPPEIVDEEIEEKKNLIPLPQIEINNVEHQGIRVDKNLLAALAVEGKEMFSSIRT